MLKYIIALTALIISTNAIADTNETSAKLAKMTFNDMYKQKVNLADYNIPYRKGILVNIWATWCKPCVEEIPSLMSFQAKVKDITVVTLSIDRHEKIVNTFFKRNRLPQHALVNLIDKNGVLVKSLGYSRVPTTLLIDNRGRIVEVFIGPRKWDSEFTIASIMASLEKASKQKQYYYE